MLQSLNLFAFDCKHYMHIQDYLKGRLWFSGSLSGREPSISSDTRTDSSTDSSSHRASRSRSLHQSTGSHLSSESQTTVVCNHDIGTPPLGADAGGNLFSEPEPTVKFEFFAPSLQTLHVMCLVSGYSHIYLHRCLHNCPLWDK